MVKYPFTHLAFLLILLVSVAFNAFCVATYWQIKPNWALCPIEPSGAGVSEAQEAFFGKVIGFYETLIYYQFGIIGILLVVCFLYTNLVSKRQAREIIVDEMYSDHLKVYFEKRISQLGELTLNELLKNEDIGSRLIAIEQKTNKIEKQLSKIEKQYDSYPTNKSRTINKKPPVGNTKGRKKANGNES